MLLACLASVPAVAHANSGTPLMWAGMLHLLFGNLLIGLLEGYVLARLFALRRRRTIILMVLANYFSAWLGACLLEFGPIDRFPLELGGTRMVFWGLVAAAYLVTLVLEFPFVAFALRGDPAWRRKAVRGSLVVQSLSYLLLFGWYGMASGASLYTRTRLVRPAEMALPKNVWVYYIAAADGDVYRTRLAAPAPERVAALHSTNADDRLVIRPSSQAGGGWDLLARLVTDDWDKPQMVALVDGFAADAAPAGQRDRLSTAPEYGTWFNFGPASRLGAARDSAWEFRCGFWPVEGLRGTNLQTGAHAGFSLETPFVRWAVRNVTQLPDEIVLFQLGRDQVCVFDPAGGRVARIARGRGPIATLGGAAR